MFFFPSVGTFKLTIEFTEEYPNKPPTVRFVSKMFHPNGMCTYTFFLCLDMNSFCHYFNKTINFYRLDEHGHDVIHLIMMICCVLCLVYADGSICLDILQNRWSPTYDVSSILTSIQVLPLAQSFFFFFLISRISLTTLRIFVVFVLK